MKPRKQTHGSASAIPQQSLLPKAKDHGSLSPEMCNRLYFSTNSRDNLPNYFSQSSSHAALVAGARPETFKTVHQAVTQYAPSKVGSIPRSMCTYSANYLQLPLDGVKVNRDLAHVFQENSTNGQTGSKNRGQSLPLSSDTTTRQSYGAPEVSASSGRGAMIMPTQQIVVDPTSKFMESKTNFQRDFHDFDAAARKRNRSEPAKPIAGSQLPPPLGNGGSPQPFEALTSYARDYTGRGKQRPKAAAVAAAEAKAARAKYEVARQVRAIEQSRAMN